MPGVGKRINVYLNPEDHELVAQRAARAGMKTPAYLRRIACGALPPAKTKDFVTHGLALVASELDAAAEGAKEPSSKRAMLEARDQLRGLLKQHLRGESDNQSHDRENLEADEFNR